MSSWEENGTHNIDFIIHLLLAQSLCAAATQLELACRTGSGWGGSRAPVRKDREKAIRSLSDAVSSSLYKEFSKILAASGSVLDVWQGLTVWIRSQMDEMEIAPADTAKEYLCEAFVRHFDAIPTWTALPQCLVSDETAALNRLLHPLMARACEKQTRFWDREVRTRLDKVPRVEILGVEAIEKWEDADLCAEVKPDLSGLVVRWVGHKRRTQRKNLLRWYFALRVLLVHEVGHCLCLRDWQSSFAKGSWLHGWLAFLFFLDAIDRTRLHGEKDQSALNSVEYEILSELFEIAGAKLFGGDEEARTGWDDARKVYDGISASIGRREAGGAYFVCPLYDSPAGVSASTFFHVFTRLNLSLPERFPGACGKFCYKYKDTIPSRACGMLQVSLPEINPRIPPQILERMKKEFGKTSAFSWAAQAC